MHLFSSKIRKLNVLRERLCSPYINPDGRDVDVPKIVCLSNQNDVQNQTFHPASAILLSMFIKCCCYDGALAVGVFTSCGLLLAACCLRAHIGLGPSRVFFKHTHSRLHNTLTDSKPKQAKKHAAPLPPFPACNHGPRPRHRHRGYGPSAGM